jgi:hypothetical protein
METEGKAMLSLFFETNLFVRFLLPPRFRRNTLYGRLTDHLTRVDGDQL